VVIDTSAITAMLLLEPEWRALAEAVDRDPVRLVSAISVMEASIVALARLGDDGLDELDLLLARTGSEVRPFSATDLSQARQAFLRFGKGRHSARLNFGDCFAYALAASSGEPLLFKGDDFSQTDIPRVDY
jgi:ribonuclease VapC